MQNQHRVGHLISLQKGEPPQKCFLTVSHPPFALGCDGGVRLNRIVVFTRDHVGLIDLDVSAGERSFGIATPRLGWPALVAAASAGPATRLQRR